MKAKNILPVEVSNKKISKQELSLNKNPKLF